LKARTKLDKLERLFHSMPPSGRGSPLADEVREIDWEIKRLEAEIAEAEADMTPEELAQSRAEQEESDARRAGLSLDEQIAVLEAEVGGGAK